MSHPVRRAPAVSAPAVVATDPLDPRTPVERQLDEAVAATPGFALPQGAIDPIDLPGGVRDELHATLDGRHYQLGNLVDKADRWPVRGARGGRLVWFDPSEATPVAAQTSVCGDVLRAKLDGSVPEVYSGSAAPSFVLDGGKAYLVDGHHSLALLAMARAKGHIDGPVPAYVHLPDRSGMERPRLDCNC